MEDQQPDPGDLTTADPDRAADITESTPAQRKRRWPFGRRPKTGTGAEPAVADDPGVDEASAPAGPQTPVGKRRRTRTVTAPTPAVDETPEGAETGSATTEANADDTAGTAPDAESACPSEEPAEPQEPEPEPVLVPHRPAGKRLLAAACIAAALFVGTAAFAASQLQPYLAERAAVNTKLDVARTAAEAITTLWTYTPDDMETLPDRSSRYLTGDFATEYRRYIDAIVATNKQAQVSNTTEVMGTAVESLTPTEATALVYTNSVSTSPVSKNIPSLRYLSYQLTLERKDAHWMITRMNAVTKLDLSPQI